MQQALSLSLGQTDSGQGQGQAKPPVAMSRDISSMTEEEQLNYALQMSMSHPDSETPSAASTNDKAIDDAEMKDVCLFFLYLF